MKATRDAFGDALLTAKELNKDILVVDCDLSVPTKTDKFRAMYPESFLQFGIQEANAIGAAAGLAVSGYRPFVCSFACFITGRYDQIRISIADNEAPVVIVGTHGGLAIGKDGTTQMGLEDINLMRGLPGMSIIHPADYAETLEAVKYIALARHPIYLRLCRQPVPEVNASGYTFDFGRGVVLREGSDITLVATGGMVHIVLRVAEKLCLEDINTRVVNIHTLKPIDRVLILESAKCTRGIVTVEDHNIYGGLGTAVAEIIAEEGLPKKVVRLGVRDIFGESADPKDLYQKHGLDEDSIYQAVYSMYKRL